MKTSIVTQSSLDCFKTCRHKFNLRYIKGIVTKNKSTAIEFGSWVHLILEYYFKLIKAEQNFASESEDLEDMKDGLQSKCLSKIEELNLKTIDEAKVTGLILGYIEKWFMDDYKNLDIMCVEKEFKTDKIFSGVFFTGKIDGLVRNKETGKYYILEHKTASIVDSNYIQQKNIDLQTITYAICIQEMLDIKISGAIHDIIIKQNIRQKKNELDTDFCERLIDEVTNENFVRIVVEFDEEKLNENKKELAASCKDISSCESFYKNTCCCIGRYGACEYLPLCVSSKEDIEEINLVDSLKSLYEVRRIHEEISETTLNDESAEE
jgi:hypothetical protein